LQSLRAARGKHLACDRGTARSDPVHHNASRTIGEWMMRRPCTHLRPSVCAASSMSPSASAAYVRSCAAQAPQSPHASQSQRFRASRVGLNVFGQTARGKGPVLRHLGTGTAPSAECEAGSVHDILPTRKPDAGPSSSTHRTDFAVAASMMGWRQL